MNIKEKPIPCPRNINYLGGTLELSIPKAEAYAKDCDELLSHIFPDCFIQTDRLTDKTSLSIINSEKLPDDAYHIEISKQIEISASSRSGIAYALWTLYGLAERSDETLTFPRCVIDDSPYKRLRGVHFYLPPSDGIDEFCRILDCLSRLGYNAIILETGGGIEYDSHPEVNAAWKRFCREAREYPGGPQGMQASEAYWKDSTHVELACSGCLKKHELKQIAKHCAMLGIEIIPEIQALSHAYYLTLAHREIAERPFERWPDSYCPSCDESYKLYFDIAEEIIEILHPKRVSVGHDEIRVLGQCPKCREKSGHDLLASDLNRLHDFYSKHGIVMMMWGEKLQISGGGEIPEKTDRYGRRYSMPATYLAIEKIPKDIIMLDWHYSQAPDTEQEFYTHGFSEIYGNFHGSLIADWQRRSACPGVIGAEVSTWCVSNEAEMGYNGWFEEIVFSAQVLWRNDFTDEKRDEFRRLTYDFLPECRSMIRGEKPYDGSLKSLNELAVTEYDGTDNIVPQGGTLSVDTVKALLAGGLKDSDRFELHGRADSLVFFHAAENLPKNRAMSWFFLDRGSRIPTRYAIDYEDGMCLTVDVDLGTNIGAFESSPAFIRPTMKNTVNNYIDDCAEGSDDVPAPTYQNIDPWRSAAVYFTRHADFLTPEGERTVYAYEWKNPYPCSEIKTVRVIDEPRTTLTSKLFAVGRINR